MHNSALPQFSSPWSSGQTESSPNKALFGSVSLVTPSRQTAAKQATRKETTVDLKGLVRCLAVRNELRLEVAERE